MFTMGSSNDLTQLIIFGATGDLSAKKILPALFNISRKKHLPNLKIIGASRRDWSDSDFSNYVKNLLKVDVSTPGWETFSNSLQFSPVNFEKLEDYKQLKNLLVKNEQAYPQSRKILYFAVAPEFFIPIIESIAKAGILEPDANNYRVIIEKPFGNDLSSAKKLEEKLESIFQEEQIFRIDHVLNRNALLDIALFRKYNSLFSQIFSKEFVDNIQVTYSESIGVEERGEFYEKTGALRDMVQSHLLEV